jgi:hypothetical protein
MIQEQPKILTCEWIRFYDRTDGYVFCTVVMIFSHKDRLFPLVLAGSFINNPSHGYYVYPAPQQDNQISCSSPFQGKDEGR